MVGDCAIAKIGSDHHCGMIEGKLMVDDLRFTVRNTNVVKNWNGIFHAAQVATLMVVCFVVTVLYTFAWGIIQSYPYSIEYEGHVLWATQQLAHGANIYQLSSLTDQPWCVIIYNPLYMLAGAGLLNLTGCDFLPLRLLTMCSTLLSFLGFFCILDRSKLSEFLSIIAVALLASCLPIFYWSGVARVDMFGFALAIWAAERFAAAWLKAEETRQPLGIKNLIVSLLLSLAAFFTKQQYVVFPICFVLFFCLKGQKTLASKYFGVWVVAALCLSTGIQLATGGYWAHITYASGLPWEWETLKVFLLPFLNDWKTIASLVAIALGTMARKSKAPLEELAALLLVVSFFLALYTMGLKAAYHNHLMCTELALFWLAVLNISKLKRGFSCLLIAAIIVSSGSAVSYLAVLGQRQELQQHTQQAITFLFRAKLKDKFVLSEDPSLATLVGAQPVMIDATTIMNMSKKHPAQIDQLLDAIRRKEFRAIVINRADAENGQAQIWPARIVKAIKQNYRLHGIMSGGNGIYQRVFYPD